MSGIRKVPVITIVYTLIFLYNLFCIDNKLYGQHRSFDEIRAEWDSVSNRSDTTVYVEKRKEFGKLYSLGKYGTGIINDSSFLTYNYKTVLPIDAIEYFNTAHETDIPYLLDSGGVIVTHFINNFDISSNDTIAYNPLCQKSAMDFLDFFLEDIEFEIERTEKMAKKIVHLGDSTIKKPVEGSKYKSELIYEAINEYGDTLFYLEGTIANFGQVMRVPHDALEKTYIQTLEYMHDKVKWMLSQKDEPWAGNNLRVRKGLYVIDFLFIREEPFDLVHKVVSNFELLPMPDLDPQKENARLLKEGRLNEVNDEF